MGIYFLDSSALLKRYVTEPGTAWVQSLFLPATSNRIAIASIGGVELVAAVSRKFATIATATFPQNALIQCDGNSTERCSIGLP